MQTKKTNMLKLKLQFFAEEPGDNAQTSEGQKNKTHRKKFIQKKSLIND
ncbi:hypothetical protein NFD58_04940 [Staphylococcus epidermidis]|nr:hypothetical protein [Staphylococcus epidermidis]